MSKNEEKIVVVEKDVIEKVFKNFKNGTGIKILPSKEVTSLFQYLEDNPEQLLVKRRGDMETDFNYKQIITYALIKKGEKYLVYKRLSGAGETRLHDKLSIGFGGHTNQDFVDNKPLSFTENLKANLTREIKEELIFFHQKSLFNFYRYDFKLSAETVNKSLEELQKLSHEDGGIEIINNYKFKNIGIINDNLNDVSKVHVGIVSIIEIDKCTEVAVHPTEREQNQLHAWLTKEELKEAISKDNYESWASIIIKAL